MIPSDISPADGAAGPGPQDWPFWRRPKCMYGTLNPRHKLCLCFWQQHCSWRKQNDIPTRAVVVLRGISNLPPSGERPASDHPSQYSRAPPAPPLCMKTISRRRGYPIFPWPTVIRFFIPRRWHLMAHFRAESPCPFSEHQSAPRVPLLERQADDDWKRQNEQCLG